MADVPGARLLSAGRRDSLRLVLVGEYSERFYSFFRHQSDYAVELFADSGEAVAAARDGRLGCDVAMTGLKIKPAGGMEVLRALREADPDVMVIISTHETNPRVVVEAMQAGASDYVIEPHSDMGAIRAVIDRAAERRRALLSARRLSGELRRNVDFPEIVGLGRLAVELRRSIRRAASTDSTVLITGESGTGKGLVAEAIHRAGAWARGPFITVNCGAIPEQLVESELFGHVRGAFTGAVADRAGRVAAADGGTLFLDEVAELSPGAQVKLLRFLESRHFEPVGDSRPRSASVRIIAATNSALPGRIAEGRFREDLFYRINVLAIAVPSLRQRAEDLPLLAQHFLEKVAGESGKPVRALSPEAMAALADHSWPGNIRELRNVIERAVIWAGGEAIQLRDLPPELAAAPASGRSKPQEEKGLDERVRNFERAAILEALDATDWVRSKAAERLRIPRTTLIRKMHDLGLSR